MLHDGGSTEIDKREGAAQVDGRIVVTSGRVVILRLQEGIG